MSLTNSIGEYSRMPLKAAVEAIDSPSGIVTTAPLCIIQVITSIIALPIILALGLLEALSYNLFKIGDKDSLSHIMPNLKSNLEAIPTSLGGILTFPGIAIGTMIANRKQPAAKIEPINSPPPEEGTDWKSMLIGNPTPPPPPSGRLSPSMKKSLLTIGSPTPPPPLERLSPIMKNSLMTMPVPHQFHEEKSDD